LGVRMLNAISRANFQRSSNTHLETQSVEPRNQTAAGTRERAARAAKPEKILPSPIWPE
jgi:hypothetical protein